MSETAPRDLPRALPSFWLLQTGGWLAYWLAMTFSRIGMYPLRYMVIAKAALTLTGFAFTLGLRAGYRPLVRRGTPLLLLLIIAVAASYVVSLLWTAVDNYLDYPIAVLVGMHPGGGRSTPVRPFVGAVYNAFTLLAWSVLYIGVRYYAALQAERERALRAEATAHRAQLEALRYQINPHFLFNALNAVSTLVTERRNDEAARMLSRVSDFLRLTLTSPTRDEIPLAEEIDYIQRYLDIERVRFGERLRVEIDVAPDAWEAAVPAFALQPLVENAVRHAIAPREEGGFIALEARRTADVVRLTLSDDGPGPGDERVTADETRTRSPGIGLANTRDRLRQLYGTRGGLAIASMPGGGTRVTLEIPFRRAEGGRPRDPSAASSAAVDAEPAVR